MQLSSRACVASRVSLLTTPTRSVRARATMATVARVKACVRPIMLAVGDQIPDVTLTEGQPEYGKGVDVKLREMFKGKKGIIFAVPGAFTPGCSKSHLPSYVQDIEKFKSKGIQVIVCTATNDDYVMYAWGEQSGANKVGIKMLADKNADLARALGVDKQSGALVRSGRYSMLVEDNVVKAFNSADDGGMECTLSSAIISAL